MKYLIVLLTILLTGSVHAMELKATVNDQPISDLDVKNWVALLKMQQPQKYDYMSKKKLYDAALDAIIESRIKKETATAAGKKITQKDIQDAKAHLEQQNHLPAGGLSSMLKKNAVSEKTLTEQIEADLLWLHYLREQAGDLNVSDLAVSKRYNAMKQNLKKQGITGDSVLLWEMAQGVLPENVDVSTTLQSKSCDAFLEHIKIGPYPESAQRGWTDPNQFPIEMRDLLKDVAVGDTVGPLRTPKGLLMMMKCNVHSQQVMPSKDQLKMQMEMEQLDVLSKRLLAEATRKAIIEKKE
ncbi:MAG: hypothetical protein II942_01685 [Alphaproteobacteria bacterium]|nr:hypothetical protein [Alphaproteobacteria bacterium]